MGTLSQAKTYGGVGSILILLGFIPTVGWVLAIVGFILTLIAIKYIADSVQDQSIFQNALIAVVISIIGVAVAGIIVAASIFRLMGIRASLVAARTTGTVPTGFFGVIGAVIGGLIVTWILLVIAAYFLRKSYNSTSTKLNVSMFHTAALIYFIGAILTIIIVGFLLILIAQILLIVAFFSIPDVATMPGSGMPPPPMGSPTSGATTASKFCVKCGAPLAQDAMFCPNCGASQPTQLFAGSKVEGHRLDSETAGSSKPVHHERKSAEQPAGHQYPVLQPLSGDGIARASTRNQFQLHVMPCGGVDREQSKLAGGRAEPAQ